MDELEPLPLPLRTLPRTRSPVWTDLPTFDGSPEEMTDFLHNSQELKRYCCLVTFVPVISFHAGGDSTVAWLHSQFFDCTLCSCMYVQTTVLVACYVGQPHCNVG